MMQTLELIGRRLLSLIPTLFIASIVVFLLIQLIPGDPAQKILGELATEEQLEALREQLGLNDPILVQYGNWLWAALQGDIGQSITSGRDVSSEIARTLPVTASVVVAAMIVATVLGITAGVVAALNAGKLTDRVVIGLASVGVAVPGFWIGLILVTVFAVWLRWLPATGGVAFFTDPLQSLRHLILPALAMGLVGAAELSRQVRGAMIQVLASDFVRTHRAKGLPEWKIVLHALKNCAVPILSILGVLLNSYLGATVVIEAVFGIPGLGGLILRSVFSKDFPIIQGIVLVMVVIVILTNLLVDVAYRLVDPRIRT